MYVAVAVSLSVIPLLKALALTVTVPLFTGMGLKYPADKVVGSEPSTVYLMTAPEVEQLRATL